MNRVDMVYGSIDHLTIIMGRIADFSVKDRKRKLRVMEGQGGQWRPPASMAIPDPPPARQNGGLPEMPSFYGMTPSEPSQMPSSYRPAFTGHSPSVSSDDGFWDLEQSTNYAVEHWGKIMAALDTFQLMLGPDFQPLQDDQHTMSPFGPVLQYKTYEIACLHGVLNLAYMIAYRAHPHMPPHAQIAAGVSAAQTARYAMAIGRISAGIPPPPHDHPLDPEHAAALYESSLPLFFAGVQYIDPAQREWTVTRLFDIERFCGNATAGVMAHGCQSAWYKMFLAGRGPPYERRYNTNSMDDRLNGSWTQLDHKQTPLEENVTDRRFVRTRPLTRLHWAMGILGGEDDE